MSRVAVIDIGSGSTSLAVFEGAEGGFVDRIHQEGENLRLIERIDTKGRLPANAVRTLGSRIRAFVATAARMGATPVHIVATSAMRDAVNGAEIVGTLDELDGVDARLISGEEEGRLAAHAVLCTPAESGTGGAPAVITKPAAPTKDDIVRIVSDQVGKSVADAMRSAEETVRERDGTTPFLSWRRLYVDFDLLSSLWGEWVLSEVELDGLQVRGQINADRTFNVSDLIARFTPASPAPVASRACCLPRCFSRRLPSRRWRSPRRVRRVVPPPR